MNDQETKEAVKKVEHDVYVSLKEHFMALLHEQDRRIEQGFNASKEDVAKALVAQNRRLDLLNEFRAQAADESKKYLTMANYEGKHAPLVDRIGVIETQIARLYGGLMVVLTIGIANLVKLWFAH